MSKEIELNSIPVGLFPLIITLYGGLKRDGEAVVFDPFHIYRESTAVTTILIRFFSKSNRIHYDENLIILKEECLQSLLRRLKSQDESCETIDLCIATICLYGIDYVRKNIKSISNSLIRMSMNRLKHISLILRQFYFTAEENDQSIENETTKFIQTVIDKFQLVESIPMQFLDLLNLLRSSLARLRSSTTSFLLEGESKCYKRVTLYLPNSLRKEHTFLHRLLLTDAQFYFNRRSCSLLHHFTKLFWILEHNEEYNTQYRMAVAMDTTPEYLLFRNDEDLLFPLTFVPQHLQNLYLQLFKKGFIMINSKDSIVDDRQCLCYGYILLECLMVISNISCKRFSILAALYVLLPSLRMHYLENFASSLLWIFATKDSSCLSEFETARQLPMNYETGLYINKVEKILPGEELTDEERRTLIEKSIEQEHQRLGDALTQNNQTTIKCILQLYLLHELLDGLTMIIDYIY